MASISLNEIHPDDDPLIRMRSTADQLIAVVNHYRLQESRELVRALQGLQKRTTLHQLKLAILSDSRESKSCLMHALLKTTLEDASIPPSTVACTYLAYGIETESAVTLANSLTARLPLEQLSGFVTEKVPASSLMKVLVRFPNQALKNGLVVIDTPELTDDAQALASCTQTALQDADACVFVIDARTEVSKNVIAFLRSVEGILPKFFFVLANAASLSELEQEEAVARLTQALKKQCGLAKPRTSLLTPMSDQQSDAPPWKQRSEAFEAELMDFARISSQASISNEVLRLAEETLSQAKRALHSRGTLLRHAKLRRAVKAVDTIRARSEEMVLASTGAMRKLSERPQGGIVGEREDWSEAGAPQDTFFQADATEPAQACGVSFVPFAVPGVPLPDALNQSVSIQEAVVPDLKASRIADPAQELASPLDDRVAPEEAPEPDPIHLQPAAEFTHTTNRPEAAPVFARESFTAWVRPTSDMAHSTHADHEPNPVAVPAQRDEDLRAVAMAPLLSEDSATSPQMQHFHNPVHMQAEDLSAPNSDRSQASKETSSRPQEIGSAHQDSALSEMQAAAPALEPSEIPDSVKAWYAMPIGAPEKPTKRSFARLRKGPAVSKPAFERIATSRFPEPQGLESPPSKVGNDGENFVRAEASSPVWRVAAIAVLAATAWALFIIVQPQMHRLVAGGPTTAQVAASQTLSPSGATADALVPQHAAAQVAIAKPSPSLREGISAPPSDSTISGLFKADSHPTATAVSGHQSVASAPGLSNSRGQRFSGGVGRYHDPVSSVSPRTTLANASAGSHNGQAAPIEKPTAMLHEASSYYVGDPRPDPSLQSALNRWINTFRSGNIKAQVACYAPFVDTYFNWRNVRPEQVQYDKERAWRKTASVHKYDVTPVSITDQGNGRKAVLLQKDWDTTTTRGTIFAGSEIEKLIFARIEGEWKIVGEQEVKILKLRRD